MSRGDTCASGIDIGGGGNRHGVAAAVDAISSQRDFHVAGVLMAGEDAVAAVSAAAGADICECGDTQAAGRGCVRAGRAGVGNGSGEDAMGCGGQRASTRDGERTGAEMIGRDGGGTQGVVETSRRS